MKRWNKFEQLCPLWWKSRLFRETQTCEVGRNGPSESKLLQVLTTHGRLWQNRSKRFIQSQNVHKAPPKSHNCSSVRPVVSYMLGTLGSNMDASEVKTEPTGCYRIYQRFERFVGNAVQTRGWASSRAWTGGQVWASADATVKERRASEDEPRRSGQNKFQCNFHLKK